MSTNLNLELLSDREKEIVELAIEGLTDQQIGNRLSITASTVNSYWVRIRGKLGHLSRTELVSKIVQGKASTTSGALEKRIRQLEAELDIAKQNAKDYSESHFLRAAIELNPEAVVVFDGFGHVILANKRFEGLLGLEPGSAINHSFEEFFAYNGSPRGGVSNDLLTRGPNPGLDTPMFAVLGYKLSRVFLLVGQGACDGRQIYCCVVRPFDQEIQMAQQRAALVIDDLPRSLSRG